MANMITRPVASAAERVAATTYLWGHTGAGPASDRRFLATDIAMKDAAGHYGFGTLAPAVRGHFSSTAPICSVRIESTDPGNSAAHYSEIALADNGAVRTWFRSMRDGTGHTRLGFNDSLVFFKNAGSTPVEVGRINNGGDYLHGTTTASPTDTSNGLILSGAFPGYVISRRASGPANTHIAFVNGGATVGSIVSSTTATSYNTSSDYRLKDEIVDLEDSGQFIDALRPRSGIWKADGSKFVGFIAHEFAEVSPTSVSGQKDAVDDEGEPVMQANAGIQPRSHGEHNR